MDTIIFILTGDWFADEWKEVLRGSAEQFFDEKEVEYSEDVYVLIG